MGRVRHNCLLCGADVWEYKYPFAIGRDSYTLCASCEREVDPSSFSDEKAYNQKKGLQQAAGTKEYRAARKRQAEDVANQGER